MSKKVCGFCGGTTRGSRFTEGSHRVCESCGRFTAGRYDECFDASKFGPAFIDTDPTEYPRNLLLDPGKRE